MITGSPVPTSPPRPPPVGTTIRTSPPRAPTIKPKRGGIDDIYGLYLGGAPLDDTYNQTIDGRLTYRFASQRRHVKTISSLEQSLVTARDSVTSLKFDGRLEPTVGSATEIGKERFLSLLGRRIEEFGHETFYYAKNSSDTVVSIIEHSHNFTLEMLIDEFNIRSAFTNMSHAAFDAYEIRDITLSRLVVESLLSSTFYDKIFIRYGHRDDFKLVPGSCLLMMALETCNASVSHDIDGASDLFFALSLDSYPGENVSDFATEALRLIKIMQGGYSLPVNTGSRLLMKVCKSSCEEFNRKIFNLLDSVKTLEYKYKVLDPLKLTKDPLYSEFGPIAILSILQQAYGRLISTHDWPALAKKLPQSNNSSVADVSQSNDKNNIKMISSSSSVGSTGSSSKYVIKCFECQGPHHVRECPIRNAKKAAAAAGSSTSNSTSAPSISNTSSSRTTQTLAPWKYIEPKNLKSVVKDDKGREWKFCTKCVCPHTKQSGRYQLSHFDSDHIPNFVAAPTASPSAPPESNMSCIGMWYSPVDDTPPFIYPSSVIERESIESIEIGYNDVASDSNQWSIEAGYRHVAYEIADYDSVAIIPEPEPIILPTPYLLTSFASPRVHKYIAETIALATLAESIPEPEANITMDSLWFLTLFVSPASISQARHPVVFDTGASLAISPFRSDFVLPLSVPPGDLKLGGMANGLKIEGMGLVTWHFRDTSGNDTPIQSMAYYVPGAKVRLMSPQRLFDRPNHSSGRYFGDSTGFHLHLDKHVFQFDYDSRNHLPIGYALVGDSTTQPIPSSPSVNLSIHDAENQNLTGGQKLLLHWHYRFGHLNLPAVQRLFRAAPFLTAKFAASAKCDMHTLKCAICEFAKAHRRSTSSSPSSSVPSLEDPSIGALKANHLKPGIQISVDHFKSRLLGRTFDSYGKASSAMYKGGCIFVDHASGFIAVEHQVGFSAVETIRAKQAFEQYALANGVVIEAYLTDSGTFKAAVFVNHIRNHDQRIHFCGANAHHKNGVAERAVRSVSNMARAMLLHASTMWKDGIDPSLWPMAVTYATYQYNHIPNLQGLCPADLFTGSALPRHRLLAIHVWGCPVYVLDPQLQAGQKLPRWQPRSRRGVFMGFSNLHSSDVPLVLNLDTGSITPQFHVVFDDYFSTVSSIEREIEPPDHWASLCLENTTFVATDVTDSNTSSLFLDDDWLTPDERVLKQRALVRSDSIRQTFDTPSAPATVLVGRHHHRSVPPPSVSHNSTPTTVIQRELDPPISLLPVASDPTPMSVPVADSVPVPLSSPSPVQREVLPDTLRRSNRANKGVFSTPRFIHESFLSTVLSDLDPSSHNGQLCYMAGLGTCPTSGELNPVDDPRVYLAKRKNGASDADNPNWNQAMNGEHASRYIEAMQVEIDALVAQRTWDSVSRPADRKVLKSTWAFKIKRHPDGTAYRFKARFCARGDLQTEGVDFFETYAPVVQWSTIRLLLSTVLTEGWTTRQVDYTNAFAQAELNEEVYVEYPKLFGSVTGTDHVLRLRKSLYGLRQAPRTFYEKLKAGLLERGWKQSVIDPCLFLKSGMICVVYVDDTIFAAEKLSDIEREISSLGISDKDHSHTFNLRNEGEVSAFLGIQITQIAVKEFLLTQTGLIDKILEATLLQDCNGCDTPATVTPLFADLNGPPFDEKWEYASVVGMLMYLATNTRPDIAYAVHQAARFTHTPRASHAAGIKRIVRYIKRTRTEGLYLRPQDNHRVDCYVDSDFGGLFSVEDKQDPICVKSRTGYVITYRGAPLVWASKLQSQVALSTMEAEYIALSQSMRDLIPLREVLKEIMSVVFLATPSFTYHSHSKAFDDVMLGTMPRHLIPQSTVYEDNDACLSFARLPKLTPRTKHIGIPYHWFRTQVEALEIHIERIDTSNQLGDQFTKGLPTDLFRIARKRLMGW